MPGIDASNLLLAIGFTVVTLLLIVSAYAIQLLISGRRLRKAQRFSSAVVEYTPALMIIVMDRDNQVVAFNQNSEMLSGYPADAMLGKPAGSLAFLPEIIRETEHAEPEHNLPKYFKRTTGTLRSRDGGERSVEWQIRYFLDEEGKVDLKIALGLDITELKLAQEKLRALTANLSIAEDRERKRIAEELHDRIGETLIVSNQKIDELKLKSTNPEMSRSLDELGKTIQIFLKNARALIFDLIPPVLYDIGLEAAIESLADHFQKQYRLKIFVESDGVPAPFNNDMAMFLFKTVRELLLNIVKHARAEEVRIRLGRVENGYQVSVEDDGIGFDPQEMAGAKLGRGGFGLFNINNQVEYYRGHFYIHSRPGAGSRFTIRLPLEEADEHGKKAD